jgi:signal recognition particle GTPase
MLSHLFSPINPPKSPTTKWFKVIRKYLICMGLGDTLRKAMDKIQGAAAIDKEVVKEAVKEIQRALIAANVDTTTVFSVSKKIEERAFEEIKGTMSRREHVTKITYDSLVELLGTKKTPENPKKYFYADYLVQEKLLRQGN